MQLLKAKIQKDQKGMTLDLEDSLVLGGNKKEKGTIQTPHGKVKAAPKRSSPLKKS